MNNATPKYHWEYHPVNNERIVLIDPEGKDAMLATDDSMGDVYLEFKSPEMAVMILDALNNYPTALAQLREAREWKTGTPDIPKNSQKAFWVAFKSKYPDSDKIYCRFLTYCNEKIMPLSDSVCEGHEPKGAVPVGDDGEYAWTGWFEFSCDNCETQWAFDREVIAWMELPQYSALTTAEPKENETR